MSDPFVAQIIMFAGTFAPRGHATCDGQLMAISQNTALFSLLGTMYGGDGKTTFALPDLQGRAPLCVGQGQGLSNHVQGAAGGQPYVTLLESEMPAHAHSARGKSGAFPPTNNNPTNEVWGNSNDRPYAPAGGALTTMSPQALGVAGGSQPHNNMMPFLGITFIIALQGIFPPRG